MDYGYEALLARRLRSIVRECDRRIETNQRRVEDNEREKGRMKPEDEAIATLSAQYDALLENGELDEASKIEAQIAEIKSKKAAATAAAEGSQAPGAESAIVGQMLATLGSHPQYQALRVCDQCGLLLSAKEDTNLDDHYIGKLHSGFEQIREKLTELERILEADRDVDSNKSGHRGTTDEHTKRDDHAKAETRESAADAPDAASVPTHAPSHDEKTEGDSKTSEEAKNTSKEGDNEEQKKEADEDETKRADTSSTTLKAPTLESEKENSAKQDSKPPLKKRTRVAEGYETELPEIPSRQRDRDRPRYGDAKDREYDRDRDRYRYSNKDRYRGRRGGGGGGGYRDSYDDRRPYRDRDASHRDRDRDNYQSSYRERDSERYRDSYRERY